MDNLINLLLSIKTLFYEIFDRMQFNNSPTKFHKSGWEVTFYDDFTGTEIDRKKWRTDTYWGGRFYPPEVKGTAPLTYLADNSVLVKDNKLYLENRKEDTFIHYEDCDLIIPYISGQIDSSPSFAQQYGYFEIRSKSPQSDGTWPAFWLASTLAWPPEVDIYEMYTGGYKGSNSFNSNVHWKENAKHLDKCMKHFVINLSDDFHVYGVEWDKKYLKFYFDGILIRRVTKSSTLDNFVYPMHIIINNGIFKEKVNTAKFPNYHIVDYVKAYKKK